MKLSIEKPINELPEKRNWYYCTNPNGEIIGTMFYFNGTNWEDRATRITTWLSFRSEVDHVLTDGELEIIKTNSYPGSRAFVG